MVSEVLPALFVSHGVPTLVGAADGAAAFLRGLGRSLPRPRAVLCVTAHWETPVPTVGAAAAPTTVHDFHGFPPHLYHLKYPAAGAVGVAADMVAALRGAGLPYVVDHQRGLDHGTWVPLMLMYPDASIPVAQLSVQPGLGMEHHIAVGRALAPLRRSGVLILGSGASVHNLAAYRSGDDTVPEWAEAFQSWLSETVRGGDPEALASYRTHHGDARLAHPRDEHLLPLAVAMGAGGSGRVLFEGFEGAIGMAAYAFDGAGGELAQPRRTRLRRDERERLIVDEAVRFFCEFGIDGQTRALADRLGITQPLLYRYFPDKNALVERVFDEIFARVWRPEWQVVIADRSRPLADRLTDFAISYARALCQDGWIRLLTSVGLKGGGFDRRVLEAAREQVILPLCRELHHELAADDPRHPVLEELAWGLHGGLYFLAQRKWLHGIDPVSDVEVAAAAQVSAFVAGVRAACPKLGLCGRAAE